MSPKDLALVGLFVLSLALRAVGAPAATAPAVDPQHPLLAPASGPLHLEPDAEGRLDLALAVAEFERLSGWRVLMSEEARLLLGRNAGPLVSGPIDAAPQAVGPVVEALLWHAHFAWTVVRDDPPRLLELQALHTTARTSARASALRVPAEELPRWAEHPATLVQAVVTMPNLDVRTVSNALRSMVVDPNLLQLVPLGDSNALMVQATGCAAYDLVALLDRANAQMGPGAERYARTASAPPAAAVEGPRTIGEEGAETLHDLVLDLAQQSGRVVVLDEEVRSLLTRVPLPLEAPLAVPGEDFATVVEELLLQSGFVVTDLRAAAPALFTVHSLDTTARTSARSNARYVDARALEECARRPATLFTTMIELQRADPRTLSNSLRSLVVDPNTLQIIPVGNSSALLLQGYGRTLFELAGTLREIDAASTPHTAPQAPPAPPGLGGTPAPGR